MSGLIAGMITSTFGLQATFATAGGIGVVLASWEILKRGNTVLPEVVSTATNPS
jgi:hypothetical protein